MVQVRGARAEPRLDDLGRIVARFDQPDLGGARRRDRAREQRPEQVGADAETRQSPSTRASRRFPPTVSRPSRALTR
jgi:hypothetical protein